MSWIDSPTFTAATDWATGFVSVVDFRNKISQRFLDLAARLADTSWIALPFDSGAPWITSTSPSDALQYRRIGPWVNLQGTVTRASSNIAAGASWSSNTIATMPATYRPTSSEAPLVYATACDSIGAYMQIRIQSTGAINVRNTGSAAMISGDNLYINVVFLTG